MDQKSGILSRARTIRAVATEVVMNPDPHRARATILQFCSHESNRRHPATAGLNTVMANKVERLGTHGE